MKNFLKIVAVYLVFGIVIALILSFGGAYSGLVLEGGLGFVSSLDYLLLMAFVAVCWLPLLVATVQFNAIPYAGLVAAVIAVLFIAATAFVIKKTK